MPFKDFLDKVEYDPEHFDFARFKQALIAEHDGDVGVVAAKVTELEGVNTASLAEVQRVKAKNFDLLMQATTGHDPLASGQQTPPSPEGDDAPSIESFFGTPSEAQV